MKKIQILLTAACLFSSYSTSLTMLIPQKKNPAQRQEWAKQRRNDYIKTRAQRAAQQKNDAMKTLAQHSKHLKSTMEDLSITDPTELSLPEHVKPTTIINLAHFYQ